MLEKQTIFLVYQLPKKEGTQVAYLNATPTITWRHIRTALGADSITHYDLKKRERQTLDFQEVGAPVEPIMVSEEGNLVEKLKPIDITTVTFQKPIPASEFVERVNEYNEQQASNPFGCGCVPGI